MAGGLWRPGYLSLRCCVMLDMSSALGFGVLLWTMNHPVGSRGARAVLSLVPRMELGRQDISCSSQIVLLFNKHFGGVLIYLFMTYKILVPQPEIEPGPVSVKTHVLTTGPPGNSIIEQTFS